MPKVVQKTSDAKVVRLKIPGAELSNAILVARIASNDPGAARELVSRFGERINNWVWSLLGRDNDHDDVVQDVYMNIFHSIPSLKKPESLGPWIDSVVIRTVRYELRKRKWRKLVIPGSDEIQSVWDSAHLHKTKHAERFYGLLQNMSVKNRILFVLRYIEEVPLDEIALSYGCSRSTIKRRIEEARTEFEKRANKDPIMASLMEGISHAE